MCFGTKYLIAEAEAIPGIYSKHELFPLFFAAII